MESRLSKHTNPKMNWFNKGKLLSTKLSYLCSFLVILVVLTVGVYGLFERVYERELSEFSNKTVNIEIDSKSLDKNKSYIAVGTFQVRGMPSKAVALHLGEERSFAFIDTSVAQQLIYEHAKRFGYYDINISVSEKDTGRTIYLVGKVRQYLDNYYTRVTLYVFFVMFALSVMFMVYLLYVVMFKGV